MIIDFHTHCFVDEIAVKAVPVLSRRAGITPASDGTIAGLLASMAEAGIDHSVLLPIATKPSQVETINTWVLGIKDKKVIPFGTLHPAYTDWKNEVKRLVGEGIKGIKFHPDYQEYFVDDPIMLPIYEEILTQDLIIIFHAGVDVGLPPPVHCLPHQLAALMRLFPGGKIIAAHMGGFEVWPEVQDWLIGTNIYLDTSYTFLKTGPEKMRDLILNHGVDKVLFGTDSPWAGQKQEMKNLECLGLSEDAWKKITGDNARKLLKI